MYARLTADLLARSMLALGVTLVVAGLLQDPARDGMAFLRTTPSERVVETDFGVYGCEGFVTSTQVPLVPGQTFAWRVLVPDGAPVAWREELILPAPPAEWSGANFVELREDGRIAVTAGLDEPWEDGFVEHAWTITEGDPAGDYELRLWIDGGLHQVFRFHVE